ncbi:MAG TPA: SUMF1/EgtB/PvdO family nonheme iron enzyme [Thermoanaerobaculia bacterium]|nr:SUMF1/EgtB/PvdO family nonheme iron enzyme [Thermoanaerobaculia bacterium]
MRHLSYPRGIERRDLLEWFRQGRARSREIFAIPKATSYYDRPIKLRNPIVFYEGHLPAFAVNTLIKLALKQPPVDAGYEVLFERGIDPESEDSANPTSDSWPARDLVLAYGAEAERRIERALCNGDIERDDVPQLRGAEAAIAILEHEQMHQETLLYMFHEMPYERKNARPPLHGVRTGFSRSRPAEAGPHTVKIPAGIATLGAAGHFCWDNELPAHQVEVPAFEIDRHDVTNGQYLDYMRATDADPPHFWKRVNGEWFWRGMFELVPLPLDAPVYATQEEASAYAKWRGMRVPTEAEYHRAAFGTPSGEERLWPWGDEPPDATRGNFGFANWDPVPVGSYPAGASAWGVHDLAGNGWEWTSTPFAGFDGFEPMASYPNYSADFFDGQHFVMKGGSPATAPELIRRSFRNWFRGNYPYVYATFRCAAASSS